MSSPDTNPTTESGAISLEVVPSSNSGDANAPASPTLSPDARKSEIVNPKSDLAYRMISRFAIENLRQAADALEAEMPELARHHAHKALEQIDHLQSL